MESDLPIPKRIEDCAISSSAPRALKTYDGSKEADVHADPEESAISFRAINSDSPSTYENDKLMHPNNEKKLHSESRTRI